MQKKYYDSYYMSHSIYYDSYTMTHKIGIELPNCTLHYNYKISKNNQNTLCFVWNMKFGT